MTVKYNDQGVLTMGNVSLQTIAASFGTLLSFMMRNKLEHNAEGSMKHLKKVVYHIIFRMLLKHLVVFNCLN